MQKKKQTKKLAVANTNIKLQNPGLVAFYDIQPGNGLILSFNLQYWVQERKKSFSCYYYAGVCC